METGKKEVFAAVVLAAGRGKRMESSVHKQYMRNPSYIMH